ncbi:hypothetical protein DRO33_06310 [Candidatus Bathyarchaeota archaeon]|nr:MAG: hypothetical protein DRO33_06310 [Candidatus Bathyarchaeota archaeon]
MNATGSGELWGLATTPTPEVSVEAALREAVQGLIALPGVFFIMVVGETGTEFLRWFRTGLDERRLVLRGQDVLETVGRLLPILEKARAGGLEELLVRAENSILVLRLAGRSLLFVMADKTVNLAMLLVRLRDTAARVAGIMA